MKTKVKILQMLVLTVVTLGTLLLTNCSQPNKYSCDDEINQWVTDNLKSFEGITRTELATYPFKDQIAIYRSLSEQKKAEIWNEKIDSVEYLNWPQNFHHFWIV